MKRRYMVLLAFLVGSNVFLYWQVKQSYHALADVEANLVTARNSVEYALNTSMQRGTFQPELRGTPLSVVVILDERGCAPCIRSEIHALNAHWATIKAHTSVYYYGDRQAYLKGHEIKFEYNMIAGMSAIYGDDLGPINPVSILIANSQILDVRVSNPTNPYFETLALAWYTGVGSVVNNSRI